MPRTPSALWLILACLSAAPVHADALEDARTAIGQGRLGEAQVRLKDLLQQNPSNAAARLLLGETQLRLRDGVAAEQEITRALDAGLDRQQALVPLAEAWLLQGQGQRVIDAIAEPTAAAAGPGAQLLVLRGEAFDILGQAEEASVAFDRAQQLDPDNARARLGAARIAYARGDQERTLQLIGEAQTMDPNAAAAWEMQGEVLYRAGDQEGAEYAFSQAIDREPGRWTAYFKRAVVRLDRTELAGAGQDLDQLVKLNKEFPGVKLVRGRLMLAKGDTAAAANHFELYAKETPGDPQGWYLAGAALFRLERDQAARSYLDKYLEIAPKTIEATLPAAQLLLQNGDAARTEALVAPFAGKPGAEAADRLLVAVLEQQGRLDEALAAVRVLVARPSARPDDQDALARLLTRTGDWAGVRDLARGRVTQAPDALPTRLLLIDSLIRTQAFDEAKSEAKVAVARFAHDARAHNALGVALLAGGDVAGARTELGRAIDLDPRLEQAAVTLSRLDLATGDPAAARAALQVLAAAAPDSKAPGRELAVIEQQQGDTAAAAARLREALRAAPDDLGVRLQLAALLLKTKDPGGAVDVLKDAPATPRIPALLRLRGAAELDAGRPAAAVATYEQLAALDPKDGESGLLLAQARAANGQFAALTPGLVEALRQVPDSPLVGPTLDLIYARLPGTGPRQELLASIADILPQHPVYHYLAGRAAYDDGETQQAIAHMRAAQRAAPHWSQPVSALVAMLVGAGEKQRALALAEDWLTKHPDDFGLRLELASLYLTHGQTDAAIAHYREVLKRQPDEAVALNNLAMLTLDADPVAALAMARKAVALEPDTVDYVDTLGAVLLRQGQGPEARALLVGPYEKNQGNPSLAYHYAAALAMTGEGAQARRLLLEIVQKTFPERADAQSLLAQLGRGN